MFYFAGSLKNEQESAFTYKLTHGSFPLYNSNHTKPRFLEDLVGNLTALFPNKSWQQIDSYNKTCEENKECLLAIARTGDTHLGQLIMAGIHKKELEKEIGGLCRITLYFFFDFDRIMTGLPV